MTFLSFHKRKIIIVLATLAGLSLYAEQGGCFVLFLFLEVLAVFGIPKKDEPRVLAREMSILINSGMTTVQALGVLASTHATYRKRLRKVIAAAENGAELSEAMTRERKLFGPMLIRIYKESTAEAISNRLLNVYCEIRNAEASYRNERSRAFLYPTIIFALSMFILLMLMIVVMPMFSEMFSRIGTRLPLPTRVTIALSSLLAGKAGLTAVAGLALAGAVLKKRTGRWFTGGLRNRVDLYALASLAKALLESGRSLEEAVAAASAIVGHKTIMREALDVRGRIRNGEKAEAVFAQTRYLPRSLRAVILSGVRSGNLLEELRYLVRWLEEYDRIDMGRTYDRLETRMTVLVSVVVGWVIISFYLPIFRMGELAGK